MIKTCPACNNKNFKPLEKSIFQCSTCGLAFLIPMPSKKSLKKLYEDIYNLAGDLISTKDAFQKKDIKQECRRIYSMEKFINNGRLLDVGASTGFFLSELRKNPKWDILGVEYSKKAVDEAKKLFGINLIHGEISHPKIPNNYFDVVTMHSVLEHIPDLNTTLDTVHNKLVKNGWFIFNVPNIASFEYFIYKILHKSFPGFIDEHMYYFTPQSLNILMKNHGFKIRYITSRHYSTLKFPPLRPIIGIAMWVIKLFLEYTKVGGDLKKGNILYVYAQKAS